MQRGVSCLVTGATGFLGRAVVAGLLKNGISVRCLVRDSARNREAFSSSSSLVAQSARSEVVRGNLFSPTQLIQAMEGIRIVYHLAAEMRGLPATIFAGTVVGSKNLLQAILRARPERVVLVSSLNVYGLANSDPRDIVTEDFALDQHPEKRDVYTHAKIWQEQLFHEYLAGSGIELTIVRPGHTYGPTRNQLPARLGLSLGGVLLLAKPGKSLPVTYVENCADAVILCAAKREAANEAYNVIDDGAPTGAEYLNRYRMLNGLPWPVHWPFVGFSALCHLNRLGNRLSAGQIPIVLTRYKAACAWRGHQFSSEKLKHLGWQQPIPTEKALAIAFHDARFETTSVGSVRVPLRDAA